MTVSAAARIPIASPHSLMDGYSFEISAKDASRLEAIRPMLPPGTMVSITYLPNETDEARVAAAAQVRRLGLLPMPHIAARRVASLSSLHAFLDRLARDASVDRLFIIAGDLPAPAGPFPDALSVIEELRRGEHNLTAVGIAGYPEGHPGIDGALLDRALLDKARSVAEHGLALEIMTQFAFDAEPMIAWVKRLRGDGIHGRLRLGLPGPANVGTLLKFAARCGVGASAKVMAKYGVSITRLLSTAGPDRLFAELQDGLDPRVDGPVAIHLYPFGGLAKMVDWASAAALRDPA